MPNGSTIRQGSPPHMRGTQKRPDKISDAIRITPAHAGNTAYVCMDASGKKDHPRTCGEHLLTFLHTLHIPGSPPHMRGTPILIRISCRTARITPAHAGNTSGFLSALGRTEDHPRTCGEHRIRQRYRLHLIGSPPHMRGTP